MDWGKIIAAGALGFAGGAYVYDVLVRPAFAAQYAREEADKRQKPMLNVGCGTASSSLRAVLLGPQICGDVNVDISASKNSECGPDKVCYADAHNLPFGDGEFGSLLCSHVLEHLERPDIALKEFHRVADVVVIVVPKWWCPHTWLHPGHKSFITENLRVLTF